MERRVLVVALVLVAMMSQVHASDPELTTDFKVPDGVDINSLNGSFFTFTEFRDVKANASLFPIVSAARADFSNFRALDGLGISPVLLVFLPGTVNAPHVHPRASELVFVIEGQVDIGFVDTTNKLRTQSLKTGDLFVTPRGLVHFQINRYQSTAKIINIFSSSGPGVARMPVTLFGSGINDDVLQKSFAVSADVIQKLKNAQNSSPGSPY